MVSLVVRFGSEVYEDTALFVEEFWRKAASLRHPQTSQLSFYALFPGTTRRSLPSSSRLMLGRRAQRVTAEVASP